MDIIHRWVAKNVVTSQFYKIQLDFRKNGQCETSFEWNIPKGELFVKSDTCQVDKYIALGFVLFDLDCVRRLKMPCQLIRVGFRGVAVGGCWVLLWHFGMLSHVVQMHTTWGGNSLGIVARGGLSLSLSTISPQTPNISQPWIAIVNFIRNRASKSKALYRNNITIALEILGWFVFLDIWTCSAFTESFSGEIVSIV